MEGSALLWPWSGDQRMRVLEIVVLAITLAGCTGDRTRQGMISPEGRPPSVASWSVAQITNTAA
jgi:hypothetical protein